MARIVVIGGSGHVGTYLLPALIQLGHEVVNVSRGTASPYRQHAAWKAIEQVAIDRKAEEAKGSFGVRIADLNPDIVVDMILFKLEGAQQLVEALRGKIEHYIFCSSIWVYGHATTVPSVETDPTNGIDEYGIDKAKIERWLSFRWRRKDELVPADPLRGYDVLGGVNVGCGCVLAMERKEFVEAYIPTLGIGGHEGAIHNLGPVPGTEL